MPLSQIHGYRKLEDNMFTFGRRQIAFIENRETAMLTEEEEAIDYFHVSLPIIHS